MRVTLDGVKLRNLRKEHGKVSGKPKLWSVEAIASRACVGEKTVRNMETGRHRSNPAQAEGFRRAYRVKVADWDQYIIKCNTYMSAEEIAETV